MNLADLCRRDVVAIDADASLREAALLMREQHVGALVVTAASADGRPRAVGIVTDRDLAIDAAARDLQPSRSAVGAVASRQLVGVPGSAGLSEAVAAMERAGVRRLLVTDADAGVIGVLSADDIVVALAGELGGLARALRHGIEREARSRTPPPPPRPVFMPYGTPGMPGPTLGPVGVETVQTG